MALNMQRVAEVKTKVGSSMFGDISKLVDGRNVLRLFSFEHVIRKAEIEAGVFPKTATLGAYTEELFVDQREHLGEGEAPVVCTGPATCPRCKQVAELAASGQVDDKTLRKMGSKSRFYVNAVDVSEQSKDKSIKTFVMPASVAAAISAIFENPDYTPAKLLGCKGRDFVISCDKKAKNPNLMYSVSLRDADKSEPLNQKDVGKSRDLFEITSGATTGTAPAAPASPDEDAIADAGDAKEPTGKVDTSFDPSKLEDKGEAGDVKVGTTVYFENEGEQLTGKVTEVNDGVYQVETDTDFWDLERGDFTTEKPKPAGKTRKTKK